MKTFEEALDAVCPSDSMDAGEARHQELMKMTIERVQRSKPLLDEAAASPLLEAVLKVYCTSACCPYHATVNAFQLGLHVGMEMERSETGGVLVE